MKDKEKYDVRYLEKKAKTWSLREHIFFNIAIMSIFLIAFSTIFNSFTLTYWIAVICICLFEMTIYSFRKANEYINKYSRRRDNSLL